MTRKKIIFFISVAFAAALVSVYICDRKIINNAQGKLFTSVQSVPYNKVGLLLGTARNSASGRINPYYAYRINATVQLIKASKIKYVIISGDNSTVGYNEPGDMRKDLISRGVDSSHIYLDYAGFRTFDSMVRAREIFGQQSVTVISQQFHNERAIYTGEKTGIRCIGFNAADVPSAYGLKVQIREKLARVKVILDFVFGNQPKFLGKKITIPA